MDEVFSDVVSKIDDALIKVNQLAMAAGVPQSTLEPILEGVKKRANIIK